MGANPNTFIIFAFLQLGKISGRNHRDDCSDWDFVSACLPSYCGQFRKKHSCVWQITVHPNACKSKYMSVDSQYMTQT